MGVRRWMLAFAIVLLIGVLWLVVATAWGIYQGNQQRLSYERERAALHYQRGIEFMNTGQIELAQVEFEFALTLQPDYPEAIAALERLQQLQQTPTPQPTATPTASPVPTPTATPEQENPLASLFEEATTAYQAADWEQAIRLLESIQIQDPTYHRDDVRRMLFEAYRAHGMALVAENRFEEGLRMLDRALILSPEAQDVREQRELAALYVDGLTYWRADWQQAIARFQKLYERAPDYRDVRQRLADAYAGYAEKLGDRGNWCAAVERYNKSLEIVDAAAVRASRDQASELCRTGMGAVAETEGAGGTIGRIAVAVRDPFARRYRILVIGEGQSTPQVMVEEATQPAWSPDGQTLAFRSLKADELGIELFTLATGQRRRATLFVEDGFPSWSPDGQQIVFASNREGDRRWRIYRTWAWAEGTIPATNLGFGRSPAWSPDGQRIAYQGCDERGNRCGLWSMAPDGSNRQPLTDDPSDTAPAWSPNGRQLAFMSYERTGRWDIYLLQVTTGKVSPLVMGVGNAGLPAWSPDGQQIAFMSDRSGTWAIYVIPAGGGAARKVADLPGTTDDWLSERISWGR